MDCFGVQDHIDASKSAIQESNIDDGFNLMDGDHIYTMQANTPAITAATNNSNPAGLILYLFCTFVRTLHINADGISFSE